MDPIMTAVVGISILLLFSVSASAAKKTARWRRFAAESIALMAIAGFLNFLFKFPFPKSGVQAKGSQEELALAVALYISMLLGMFAQFLYHYFGQPVRRRTKFEWGLFIAPVFASPIIFIPLMIAFQNAKIDLQDAPIPRLMIFLVAFQNGFFWKEHFDRKRREIEGDAK